MVCFSYMRKLTNLDDGIVRVWSAVDDPSKFRLVSSWRAFPGLIPGSKGAGLVLNWQPEHSSIVLYDCNLF